MIKAFEDYVGKIIDRFNEAVKFLWIEELTGQTILEIETNISEKPSVPLGFWDKWPEDPTSTPLYMRAGHSALHVAAQWSDSIQGAIAYGRLRALERQPKFCTELTDQQAKAWIEAAVREASNHTDMACKPTDRFREVDFLRRKIDTEYAQWLSTQPKAWGRKPKPSKEESKGKQIAMIAKLSEHPTLQDHPEDLAAMFQVDVSTVRRWLNRFREA
jgi:hypothetical protein